VLFLLILLLTIAGGREASAQATPVSHPDSLQARLLKAIRQIPIIDNQAHPALPGDVEMDALTFDSTGVASPVARTLPFRLRPTNLELIPAFHALYEYPHADLSLDHLRELATLKRKKRTAPEVNYFNTVLNKAGISLSLANRVDMAGTPLDRTRFKWVPFLDAYLFPLNNSVYKKQGPESAVFFSCYEKLLKKYYDLVETSRPRTFEAYLRFVHESFSRLKADGAVAVKFAAAYLRPLAFDDVSPRQARRIYERYRNTTDVPEEEYRKLQNYLFFFLLREATRFGLPVHIHTGAGMNEGFRLNGAHPLLLENVVTANEFRQTRFVLLQGGAPFTQEAILLATNANVFVDTSGLTLLHYPSDLAAIFKQWLSLQPEKVLFATDARVVNELIGAEEVYWLATENGRQALALALSEMVQEKRCDEAEALRLAHLLLRDNAAKLYGLP